MEGPQPAPAPSGTLPDPGNQGILPTPLPETPPKSKLKKWPVLLLFFLTAIGIAGYFAYQNYQVKPEVEKIQTTPTPAVSPTPIEELGIKWLQYQNEKYSSLKFKYPEGASITVSSDPNPEICEMEGCFSLTLTYQDLQLKVEHFTGIGGKIRATTYPYLIVSGDYFEGIGKRYTAALGTTHLRYFRFQRGGQQFGGFLGSAQSFVFTMPTEEINFYEPIADIIACSVFSLEPNEKEPYSKAYLDTENNSIIGINDDRSAYTILSGNKNEDEKANNLIINPTGQYLAIKTTLGNGPDSYLYVYDLEAKNLVEIDNEVRHSVIGDPVSWIEDYEFIMADRGKYYRYYVQDNKREKITAAEYSSLFKKAL